MADNINLRQGSLALVLEGSVDFLSLADSFNSEELRKGYKSGFRRGVYGI